MLISVLKWSKFKKQKVDGARRVNKSYDLWEKRSCEISLLEGKIVTW